MYILRNSYPQTSESIAPGILCCNISDLKAHFAQIIRQGYAFDATAARFACTNRRGNNGLRIVSMEIRTEWKISDLEESSDPLRNNFMEIDVRWLVAVNTFTLHLV